MKPKLTRGRLIKEEIFIKRFEGWKLESNIIKGRSRLAASGFGAYVGENDVVYLADKVQYCS